MKAKNVVPVLVATGLITFQAFAAEADGKAPSSLRTQAAFTEADALALFDASGKPMQVAELSSAEMKETEGASLFYRSPVLSLPQQWRDIMPPSLLEKLDSPSYGIWGGSRVFGAVLREVDGLQ